MSIQITHDSNISTNIRERIVAIGEGNIYKMKVKKSASRVNSQTSIDYLLSVHLSGEIEAVELQLPAGAMQSLVEMLEDSLDF